MSTKAETLEGVVIIKVSSRPDTHIREAREKLRKERMKKRRRTINSIEKTPPPMTRDEIIKFFSDMKDDLNKLAHR